MTTKAIHPGARIGHVPLKVADLQRSLDFYCGVLGLELQQQFGDSAAFISAGGYHHYIGLNTWESLGGNPPAPGMTGLYHTALLYPDAGCAVRCTEASDRGEDSPGWRGGSRRQRGLVPA